MERAVFFARILYGKVRNGLIAFGDFGIFALVIVLAERIAFPVFAEENAAQVGVVEEDDAVEVIGFTLVDVGNVPKVRNAVEAGRLFVLGHHFDVCHLEGFGIGERVNHAHSLFAPVGGGEVLEQTIAFGFQSSQALVQVGRSHHFGFKLVVGWFGRSRSRTSRCRTWGSRFGRGGSRCRLCFYGGFRLLFLRGCGGRRGFNCGSRGGLGAFCRRSRLFGCGSQIFF